MDYDKLTKDELIQMVEELKVLNEELLKEKEQEVSLDFAWTGNLGHWYWNFKTNAVTFNPLKVTALGYTKDEIPEKVDYQFFTDKLHPEDYDICMDAMRDHLYGKSNVYEVEYRIRTKDGKYKWYYDRGKITRYDKDGKPLFLAGIVFDITERKEMKLALEEKNKILCERSITDGLTNLKNRMALIEQLSMEIDMSIKDNKPLSLAIFDIDNFKKINDTKGHVFGDKVLVQIADIMQKGVRETDFIGRYGGEEFIIIFSNTNLKDAICISERIRKMIQEYSFDDGYKVTTSGGVYEYQGGSLEEFINKADKNLYKAKQEGKNKIVWDI